MGICFQKFFIFTKQDTGNRNSTVCVLFISDYHSEMLFCTAVQPFRLHLPSLILHCQYKYFFLVFINFKNSNIIVNDQLFIFFSGIAAYQTVLVRFWKQFQLFLLPAKSDPSVLLQFQVTIFQVQYKHKYHEYPGTLLDTALSHIYP